MLFAGQYAILGTWAGGVWIRPVSEILSALTYFKSQSYFTMYPNPAKDKFTISLSITGVKVDLFIYNIWGELVYSDSFNNTIDVINANLSPGIYTVKLNIDGRIETKKLVITL